jgi:hypothetical protein
MIVNRFGYGRKRIFNIRRAGDKVIFRSTKTTPINEVDVT